MKARAARVNEKALVRLAVEVEAGLVVSGVEETEDYYYDFEDDSEWDNEWDDFEEYNWRELVVRLGYRHTCSRRGVVLVGPAPVRFVRRMAV